MTDSSPRPVLGIWGYSSDKPDVAHHDSGAAIVCEGRILAAVNEERITRMKNEGRWPSAAIETVLRLANVRPEDIRTVAMAGLPPLPRARLMASELVKLARSTGIILPNRWLYSALTAKKLKRYGPPDMTAAVHFVAHHDAHAASAYYTSPFESCAVVTLDGIGDSAHCGAVYAASAGKLRRIRSFTGYASPGILYSYVTKAFGFKPARHEGKITGLAAHGNSDVLIQEFRKRLRYEDRELRSTFIPHLFAEKVDAEWKTSWIDELCRKHSREDICAALQRHTEEICAAIVRDALDDTGMSCVALAGGVFANVRVNQKIHELIPRDDSNPRCRLWIHPHMGDGGLSAGSALFHEGVRSAMPHAYLGDDAGMITDAMVSANSLDVWRPDNPQDAGNVASAGEGAGATGMPRAVAAALAEGLIVGRAAGPMEYGPRALGNRTIFVSADDASVNDSLNVRLKRTEFMPFAPIMTESAAARYLIGWNRNDRAAEFMTVTYDVTDDCRRDAPAIVHVDGTARPQVVGDDKPFLRDLLVEYGKLTGKEIVINTSFNIHEEPIVRTADDALKSYLQGAVDVLAFQDVLVATPEIMYRIRRRAS